MTRHNTPTDQLTVAAQRAAWLQTFLAAVAVEARTGRPFTCFDLARRHELPEPPGHHLWGTAMGIAHRQGMVATVAATPSSRPRTARSLVRLWVGARHVEGGEVA